MAINQNNVLIIMPTLNEVDTIHDLISDIFVNLPQINILVVDDGSQDGTYESLKEISNKNENLQVINRHKRLGLGSAYRDGFIYAKENQYTHVIQMDGDGSHQVDDLKKLLMAENNLDLVVGSRYVGGGNILGWKFSRKFISRAGNIFAKYALRLKIKDATSGFKRLSRNIFADNELLASKTNGYGFQVEIIHFCKLRKLSMVEIPIIFIDRRFGYSKFNKFIVLEAFVSIIKWINKR